MPYDITDKTAPFYIPFGIVNIHSGNGKFVRHKSSIVGNGIQVTAQFALAMGVQHAVRKITYDGQDISSAEYQFYKGTPGQIASLSPDGSAPSFFPTDVNHWKDANKSSASFINVRYPLSVSNDNQPGEKTVFQLDSTETKRYNSAGAVIDFGYSPNPARPIPYVAELLYGNVNSIDFGALHEFEAWCDELIPVTKDGVTIYVPRFRFDGAFAPPFTFKQFLNRICQLTCSDWQERPKIRMIPPKNRPVDFVFNPANLAWDFQFEPINAKAKFNGVIGEWRDLDDPLKGEAEPIIVDRRPNEFVPKKFYQLNLSGCYRDQGERVAHYTAKIQCDLTDFAAIRASYAAYPVLPCDLGKVTHPTPAWNNVPLKVLRKKEKEDRISTEGIERNGTGYPTYVRREPEEGLYSDTDFDPVTTRTQIAGLNPYAAPPSPTLLLTPTTSTRADGSSFNSIVGKVTFNPFGFGQKAKVYVKRPIDADYVPLDDLTPDTNNIDSFVARDLPAGNTFFKIANFSHFNVPSAPVIQSFNIPEGTAYIDGFAVSELLFRVLISTRSSGQNISRDNEPVPASAISARYASADFVGDSLWVAIQISLNSLGLDSNGKPIHNQTDTVDVAEIDVFTQFGGSSIATLSGQVGAIGGTIFGSFPSKYASLKDGQGYVRIKVRNRATGSFSNVVYLQGNTISQLPPTAKIPGNCPLEFSAAVLSDGLRFSYQFGGAVYLFKRKPGTMNWGSAINYATASPFDMVLPANDESQYLLSSATPGNWSNIIQAKTLPQTPAPPSYPAPFGISASRDATFPTTIIQGTVSLATNDKPTNIYNYGNYVMQLAAGVSGFSISGLSEGQTLSLTARHDYGSGHLSEPTTAFEITTAVTPPSAMPPEITSGYYDLSSSSSILFFQEHGGSANFTVDYNDNDAGWVRLYTATVPANATSFSHTTLRANYTRIVQYRIARNGQTGFGNEFGVEIPLIENQPNPGGCFAGWTPFDLTMTESVEMAELYERRLEFIGLPVLSFDRFNNRNTRTLLDVYRTQSDKCVVATFSNGLTRKSTPSHRFWTEDKKFVSICDLQAGDKVFDKYWNLITIEAVEWQTLEEPEWFYNVVVYADKAYFVEFAVSNQKPAPDV